MVKKYINIIICCMLIFMFGTSYAEENNGSSEYIEYDVTYEIVSGSNPSVETEISLYNGYTSSKNVALISVLYRNGKMLRLDKNEFVAAPLSSSTRSIVLDLPENAGECYLKIFVWEDLQTIKPLVDWKKINDLDNYAREKFLYISAAAQEEINVYMKSAAVKGESDDIVHTISFDPLKFAVVDLCALTYEKELASGNIPGTGITAECVSDGVVKYSFGLENGRNSGIINVLKLRSLDILQDEQINYIIN